MPKNSNTLDPINSILDRRLYLGNRFAASALDILKSLGVTHVVNCSLEQPNFFPNDLIYYNCNLRDSLTEQIEFEGPLRFIQQALASGGVVFVHCAAGVSRSASIVIGYLMRTQGLSKREALRKVAELRPCIKPNSNFLKQLSRLEGKHSGQACWLRPHGWFRVQSFLLDRVGMLEFWRWSEWFISWFFEHLPGLF